MNSIKDHVISLVNSENGKEKFLHLDSECGYLMTANSIQSAAWFSFEEAQERMKELLEGKPYAATDGTLYPPDYIHRGLAICNHTPSASGVLSIKRIELVLLSNTASKVKGEIKRPTGYTYD